MMKRSVARHDDGIHSFFTSSARKILETMTEDDLIEKLRMRFRPGRCARSFKLPTVIWLGIFAAANAMKGSMDEILAAARTAVEGGSCLPLHARTLTQSGWSRSKARLSLGLLKRLWRHWVNVARDNAGDAALFHGLRLVAFDGKSVNVPESLWTTFRSHKRRKCDGQAQGKLMVAYDVCVRVPLELAMGEVHTSEHPLARKVLKKLPDPSLLLIDAGLYSIRLFARIRATGHHFLARMPSGCKPKLIRRLGQDDGIYEIRSARYYWKDKDPSVPKTMIVRIVLMHWKGFRPCRLVTSLLDPEMFPREDIIDLYHRRWHIETFFRELSEDVKFEHWHTRTLKGLYVELLFYMIYVTIVRAHMAQAAKAAGVLPGSLSFARGASTCIRAWCRIGKCPPAQHQGILDELIAYIGTFKIDVRPGRCFERNKQKRRAVSREKKLQALEEKQLVA